jgi:hypothetical protein
MMTEQDMEQLIKERLPAVTWEWLQQQAVLVREEKGAAVLNKTFSFIPRKTGVEGSIDRICRVWLLMQVESADQRVYLEKIDNLFSGASMNEEVALYSALPVLAYPIEWQKRCAVGVRSNIGPVLEAIMYDNPYPSEHLAEPAWNQMVLKAFFTDKDVRRIVGLDQRANPSLAGMLFDYARERKAAGRGVDPELWRLTAAFPEADRGAIGG